MFFVHLTEMLAPLKKLVIFLLYKNTIRQVPVSLHEILFLGPLACVVDYLTILGFRNCVTN